MRTFEAGKDLVNLVTKEGVFYLYFGNNDKPPVRVIDCKSLYSRIKIILEEVACDIKCVRGYQDIVKHCSYCYGFYFDQNDSRTLYRFKKLPRDEKRTFLLALRKLRAFFPPINHFVWNRFGLEELTGGFCKLCQSGSLLGDKKRRKQIEEGNFDCFGKGLIFCDQEQCTYLEECLATREEYYFWLKRVEFLKEMGSYHFKIIHR